MNENNISNCWKNAYHLVAQGRVAEATDLCEQKQCSKSIDCQRYLGWAYYEKGNADNALIWFKKAIEQGDIESLYGKGCVYYSNRDYKNAFKYYKNASNDGYIRAYYWLGCLYEYGLGLDKNLDLASIYYHKASQHGYLVADRAIINLVFKNKKLLPKLMVLPKFVYILIKCFFIALRDINDERILDVPKGKSYKNNRT